MKSLITFISEESKKKGRKVSTTEVREIIDLHLAVHKEAIQDLEQLRVKTYQYDKMEHTLVNIKLKHTILE